MTRVEIGPVALCCMLALAGCGPAVPVAPTSAPVASDRERPASALDPDIVALARSVWSRLDSTTYACDEYDYFPTGGARNFGCHLSSLISFERVVQVSRLRPFISGPHAQGLDFTSSDDFGHYNPEFVRFLADYAVPAARDPAFRAATQAHYDTYVRPLARIMYATYQKLVGEPACFDAERREYAAAIASGRTRDYVEPWFFFMNPGYCDHRRADFEQFADAGFDGGYDGNVVKTCVGFWLRRSMDGTAPLFFDALTQLVNTYEQD